MAAKVNQWNDASFRWEITEALQSSAGAADAGKVIALDATGQIDPSMLPAVSIDSAEAGEALSAGDAIQIYDDAGTRKLRLADASSGVVRACHGFMLEAAALGEVKQFSTDLRIALTGIALGTKYYLSTTAGQVTASPAYAAGNLLQAVGGGIDTDVLFIEIQEAHLIV